MLEFSSEAVLLRRKAYAEHGYRPVPVDRHGHPAGAAWLREALQDPPAATVRPVDANSPYTALLGGQGGMVMIEVEGPTGLNLQIPTTPLVRAAGERFGFLYRVAAPIGAIETGPWCSPEGKRAELRLIGRGVVTVELDPQTEAPYRWLHDKRPEEVGLTELPEKSPRRMSSVCWSRPRSGSSRRVIIGLRCLTSWRARSWSPAGVKETVSRRDRVLRVKGRAKVVVGRHRVRRRRASRRRGRGPNCRGSSSSADQRPRAASAGLRALYRDREAAPFYNRGGELVRIVPVPSKAVDGQTVRTPAIRPVPFAALGRALGLAARWFRYNPQKVLYSVDPPSPVVEMILGMTERWRFPPLAGVVRTPTLRPDMSLLNRPGYDAATGLFADFGDLKLPHIAEQPTRCEAETALALLLRAYAGFPFVDPRDRAAAVAGMMSAVVRAAVDVVPMFGVTAPTAGTGKSYLVDCVAAAAIGERAAVIAMAPDQAETEKRLVGAVLFGPQIIALDNVRQLLSGDLLCQLTERPLVELRPLGTSDVRHVRNTFVVFATGNNLTAADDMVRRVLLIGLDANVERPEERQFDNDPRLEILEHRGEYIAACLTIAR